MIAGITLVIGFIIGYILSTAISKLTIKFCICGTPIGTLRIDRSDPFDGPHMFLELSKTVNDISDKKYVTLKISNESYISRK